jgi:hypothetical protein
MSQQAALLVDGKLHAHHWSKAGEHHSRRGCASHALVAWPVLVVLTKIPVDLPLHHCLYQ